MHRPVSIVVTIVRTGIILAVLIVPSLRELRRDVTDVRQLRSGVLPGSALSKRFGISADAFIADRTPT